MRFKKLVEHYVRKLNEDVYEDSEMTEAKPTKDEYIEKISNEVLEEMNFVNRSQLFSAFESDMNRFGIRCKGDGECDADEDNPPFKISNSGGYPVYIPMGMLSGLAHVKGINLNGENPHYNMMSHFELIHEGLGIDTFDDGGDIIAYNKITFNQSGNPMPDPQTIKKYGITELDNGRWLPAEGYTQGFEVHSEDDLVKFILAWNKMSR